MDYVITDCIFKILPMQRYSAQEQFKKATQTTRSMPDVVILQKLRVRWFSLFLSSLVTIKRLRWRERVEG